MAPGNEPEQQSEDLVESTISRRRFAGLTGAWAGALALGTVDRAEAQGSEDTGTTAQAARFLAQFDNRPPFTFLYGGKSSPTLLAKWPRTHQRTKLDANRTQHTITWRQSGGLQVRCEVVEYHDFSTIDWTLYFTNGGKKNGPALSNVLALDTTLQGKTGADWVVHTSNGSSAGVDQGLMDCKAIPYPAWNGRLMLFTCMGGRPTNGYFAADQGISRTGSPYYNIDWGGAGAIVVVGWPGQWATNMARDAGNGLHIQAGMCSLDGSTLAAGLRIQDTGLTDIALHPGEEIRTPRIVVQFWQEPDWIAAQNVWRRWMLAHNMPRSNGRLPAPMCPAQDVGAYGSNMLGRSMPPRIWQASGRLCRRIRLRRR